MAYRHKDQARRRKHLHSITSRRIMRKALKRAAEAHIAENNGDHSAEAYVPIEAIKRHNEVTRILVSQESEEIEAAIHTLRRLAAKRKQEE